MMIPLRKPALTLVALTVALTAVALSPAVAAATELPTSNVTATWQGKTLAPNPKLYAGDIVGITVRGFLPNEGVPVLIDNPLKELIQLTADSHGVVTYEYKVGNLAPNQYHLTFIASKVRVPPTSTRTSPGRVRVDVSIPPFGRFPFQVLPGGRPVGSHPDFADENGSPQGSSPGGDQDQGGNDNSQGDQNGNGGGSEANPMRGGSAPVVLGGKGKSDQQGEEKDHNSNDWGFAGLRENDLPWPEITAIFLALFALELFLLRPRSS